MIGATIVHLDSVDSTNNYAATQLLTKRLNEGTVFVANCQHNGRGQASSVWESETGMNLTFSIVLYPQSVEAANQFLISKAVSLGVSDFLVSKVPEVSVKWPNDIYVGDKKIAGILIETSVLGGRISHAIVGIGLNVNQEMFLSDAPNPVSLRNLTGETYLLDEMLMQLCMSIESRYKQLLQEEIAQLDRDYENMLYRRGIPAKYSADGSEFAGVISGVGPYGKLVIEIAPGKHRSFMFKEVIFI
jgi:BirA family biotin operon repressor/biotin-[acetyl-CoA-carboxylase] ligase